MTTAIVSRSGGSKLFLWATFALLALGVAGGSYSYFSSGSGTKEAAASPPGKAAAQTVVYNTYVMPAPPVPPRKYVNGECTGPIPNLELPVDGSWVEFNKGIPCRVIIWVLASKGEFEGPGKRKYVDTPAGVSTDIIAERARAFYDEGDEKVPIEVKVSRCSPESGGLILNWDCTPKV